MGIPTEYQGLNGFKTVYSETDLRIAIAVAEVLLANNIGTGGGGGELTQAEVQAAIESATNINDLESLITALLNKLPSTLSSDRLKVDGSGATQPISAAALPLPTGASTATNQSTGNTSLSSIDTKIPTKGAAIASNSMPVTLSTDGQFATNFGQASDVSASSDTGTFGLLALFKRLLSVALSKGQQVMSASLPVVLASNQSSIPVVVASSTVRTLTYVTGTISSSGDNTIIAAAGSGIRIFITAITAQLETTTTTTVLFKSGATTFRRLRCVSDGDGISLQYSPGQELRLGTNEAFILNLSGANTTGYSVEYYVA